MIGARIIVNGGKGEPTDCRLACPLREGDHLVMQCGDEKAVFIVDQVLHCPVNLESEAVPSILYVVSKVSRGLVDWKQLGNSIVGLLKG